jgi:hypothetical protein
MTKKKGAIKKKALDLFDEGVNDQGIEDEDTSGGEITEPFNPALIRVETKSIIVDAIIKRINHHEIDLQPDFQREDNVWNNDAQSRLIESMLIRIPLPAFYVDATDENKWLVVDGLQRLSALKRFVIDKKLTLSGLEFLTELGGKKFDQLPRNFQRRIEETQLIFYSIEKGTPEGVKYNIFKRINTGGEPLSAQEIRHALNPGPATKFLSQLSTSDAFKLATLNSVSTRRMVDREFVLRFLAFILTPYTKYTSKDDLDSFLKDAMKKLNDLDEKKLKSLSKRFERAMMAAHEILDLHAFRKLYKRDQPRYPVNRALFESWSVNFDQLKDEEINLLIKNKEIVKDGFIKLMKSSNFEEAISQGTGDVNKVKLRFGKIGELLKDVLLC